MCQPVYDGKSIVQLAESVSELSTLVAAVVAGGLADTLSSPGPFTVFAPTNEAFSALPAGALEKLMKPENKKELVDILTYHVLPEAVFSTDLKASQAVKTVEGRTLEVTKSGGLVRVGPSSKDLKNVIKADNLASNGVVHVIDGVLLPPSPTAIVVSNAAGVGLPACPKAIFNGFCHPWELRDGGVACVRDVSAGATITKPSDVQCVPRKNGGSSYRCPSWVPQMCQPVYDGKNIVQLAESVSELSTLVAAVVAGDLADTLSSTGPFTVFAPTNKAFSALPAGTLGKLMKP